MAFALKFITDPLKSKMSEKHFYKYIKAKLTKKCEHSLSELEQRLSDVDTDDLKLIQNNQDQAQLLINDADAETLIRQQFKNVALVHGDTTLIFNFGLKIGDVEIESKDVKQLRADVHVVCSTFYLTQMLSYVKIHAPILQVSS